MIFSDEQEAISRKKRFTRDDLQQNSSPAFSFVQKLIKQELGLLQNQFCAKNHTLAKQDQKVTEEDEEDRETEGNWVLPEELAQKGHLVNMDL